jgi:putative tryptophan/tyrosine transport system substrate-binding protein
LLGFPENDPLTRTIVTSFTQALQRLGWLEGKNLLIDWRFAAGDPGRFKTYAAELVGGAPDAILASPGTGVAALLEQTRTIPIVFALLPDPVAAGFVESLARPGGNITGFSSFDGPMMAKWLQLLKDIDPSVTRVGVLFNPATSTGAFAPLFNRAIEAAAPALGVTVTLAAVHDDEEIETAIAALAHQPDGGLICLPDSFNSTHRDVIIAAATRYTLPLIGTLDITRAGGLLSYVFDPAEMHAQAAGYIDRILKGASPAELPIQQPTKYSLVVNLKTAKALGLTVPPSMLDLADEVIE